MRSCILTVVAVGALAGPALADHQILVPRADSTADWATRKQVEGAVLGLARKVDRGAARLDDGFAALAEAAGCKGDVEKCKGAVLDAVSVDELVIITIAPAGDGKAKVTVQRVTTGKTKAATAVVPTEEPEQAVGAAFAPLFGLSKAAGSSAAQATGGKSGGGAPPPPQVVVGTGAIVKAQREAERGAETRADTGTETEADTTAETVADTEAETGAEAVAAPRTEPIAAPPPEDPTVTAAPTGVIEEDRPATGGRRRLYVAGVATGGGLVALGALMWVLESGVQSDLNDAPDHTSADVQHLRDLEAKGDRYALLGNICVIGGVAVAGTAGFLWWRSSRHGDRTQARIVPTVLDGGAGIGIAGGWR